MNLYARPKASRGLLTYGDPMKKKQGHHLIEKTVSSQKAYQGHFLTIYKDQIQLADGLKSQREYIKHPGAAMIIPVLPNGNLIMIRQFRYAPKKIFIEFPAGKCDPGENHLTTAKRELAEETGFKSNQLKLLTHIHPVIGYSNEIIYIYLAKKLEPTQNKLDPDERLDVFEITIEQALKKLWKHEITDVKTQIGLIWLAKSKKLL